MSSRCYQLYGLQLRSQLELPGLSEGGDGGDRCDAQIRLGVVEAVRDDTLLWGEVSADRAVFSLPSVGAFAVSGGAEIVVDRDPAASAEVLGHHLLGSALGLLLQQRGLLVLHASVVELGGRAAVLLGATGEGKSTLAAFLHRQGCGLVADDLAAVELSGARPLVHRGPPRIRLMPDAAALLKDEAGVGSRTGHDGKLELATRSSTPLPVELGVAFVLEASVEVDARPLSPVRGIAALMRRVYRIDWYSPRLQARHFDRCARLSERVPVHVLSLPRSMASLQHVARRLRALVDEPR